MPVTPQNREALTKEVCLVGNLQTAQVSTLRDGQPALDDWQTLEGEASL